MRNFSCFFRLKSNVFPDVTFQPLRSSSPRNKVLLHSR
jgi:hypothetical protein